MKKIPKGVSGATKNTGKGAQTLHFEHEPASAPGADTVPPFKSLPDLPPSHSASEISPPQLPILPTGGDAQTHGPYNGQAQATFYDQTNGQQLTPPATSYGVPFKLNSDFYNFTNANLGLDPAYQSIVRGLSGHNINELPNIESFPPYPGQLPSEFISQHGLDSTNYNTQHKHQLDYDFDKGIISHPDTLKSASAIKQVLPSRPSGSKKMSPQAVRDMLRKVPVGTLFSEVMAKMKQQSHRNKRRPKPHNSRTRKLPLSAHLLMDDDSAEIKVIKSVGYELGPNGPTKIH